MKIKLLYHPSSKDYPLYKNLGFTHMEISKTAWPGDYPAMIEAVNHAHDAGLHAAYAPEFFNKNGVENEEILFAFGSADLCEDCIIMLDDEPNLRKDGIFMTKVSRLRTKELRPDMKTIVTLSSIRSWRSFADVADIVFIDYYKCINIYRAIKMFFKVKTFNFQHRGEMGGVVPIRYNSKQIERHAKFWKFTGADHLAWYSATPNEEQPPWFQKNLLEMPEILDAIKKANETAL